jgi:spore maturation protein CgeB
VKLIFHGHFATGGTVVQRENALLRRGDVQVIRSPIVDHAPPLLARVRHRAARLLGRPSDLFGENRRLLDLVQTQRPDAVLIYNSRSLLPGTIETVKRLGAVIGYFDTDDAVAHHNLTPEVVAAFPLWDVFFTQKTFNLVDLPPRGVRKVVLSTNIFDPELHRPMSPEEVGPEFERYDLVFVGTFEKDRAESLLVLAEAGFSILVHGAAAGRLSGGWARLEKAGITVRPAALGRDYARAIHRGKVALGFLRKLHRDQVTHRSIELTAMGRAMLAEKTPDHDAHFVDGIEYVGFTDEADMIAKAWMLLDDAGMRKSIGLAARARCLASDYDVDAAMAGIVREIRAISNA